MSNQSLFRNEAQPRDEAAECIQDGDIVYLRIKQGYDYLYISRAQEVFGRHNRWNSASMRKNFSVPNLSSFRPYLIPPDYYASSLKLNEATDKGPLTTEIGTLTLDVFQKPSLSAKKDDRVPFLLERMLGPGTLLLGQQFRLLSLEPSLSMSRRYITPVNRENNLSYGDTTNEIAYADSKESVYSTIWWIPPSAQGGPHQWRDGMPVTEDETYSIFQVTRQSVLGIIRGNLCTKIPEVDVNDVWQFEKIKVRKSTAI